MSAGVRVWCYLDDRELALHNATDKVLLSPTSSLADLERERVSQRTRDALERKHKAGHVTGGSVFGYRNVPVFADTSEAGGPRKQLSVVLEINPEEARVVTRIFEMAARGMGYRSIAIRV